MDFKQPIYVFEKLILISLRCPKPFYFCCLFSNLPEAHYVHWSHRDDLFRFGSNQALLHEGLKTRTCRFWRKPFALRFGNQKIISINMVKNTSRKPTFPFRAVWIYVSYRKNRLVQSLQNFKSTIVWWLKGQSREPEQIRKISSVYVRDPDLNLIEISEYLQ